MQCPRCGGELECDMVDNGVGMEQCGPYGCPACHYVEPRLTLADDEPPCPRCGSTAWKYEGDRQICADRGK